VNVEEEENIQPPRKRRRLVVAPQPPRYLPPKPMNLAASLSVYCWLDIYFSEKLTIPNFKKDHMIFNFDGKINSYEINLLSTYPKMVQTSINEWAILYNRKLYVGYSDQVIIRWRNIILNDPKFNGFFPKNKKENEFTIIRNVLTKNSKTIYEQQQQEHDQGRRNQKGKKNSFLDTLTLSSDEEEQEQDQERRNSNRAVNPNPNPNPRPVTRNNNNTEQMEHSPYGSRNNRRGGNGEGGGRRRRRRRRRRKKITGRNIIQDYSRSIRRRRRSK